MKTKTLTVISMILLSALVIAGKASAADANEQGFEIAARSDRTDVGFGASEVELQMVLRNAAGQEATRELRIATLEKPDETVGDKSLVLFEHRAT